MRRIAFALSAVCGLALASAASAQTWMFGLDGLQETPPNDSPGSGFAIVKLTADTNFLEWDITFGGLVAPVTGAHFHEAPVGEPGPIKLDIGAISGLDSPMIGSAFISDDNKAALLAGNWYINIHSQVFPGGEIRGQVVPAPAAAALIGLGGLAAARRRR